MKIEEQVVNLQLSKRLKELGFKQEGVWWWNKYSDGWVLKSYKTPNKMTYVAPTCAEMAEALPPQMFDRILEMAPYCKDWTVRYCHYYAKPPVHHDSQQYADTLANAMAEMWIYLKEKGLL